MSDYFVFGDVDSRDYSDIHVFDKSVDNTPKRVYDVQNIAGRNGAFYVDQGRYEDVEHSYGVVALTKSAGSNFINALVSQIGYHRLSDSFNEDEFYLATLTDAVEAKVSKSTRDVNTFDITFTRKPQRFLLSGEVPKVVAQNMVPPSTKTETGSIVSIESDGGDKVTSLVAQIEPVQAGSGDPSPTNVRPITGWTAAAVNVAGKNLLNPSIITSRANATVDDGVVTATKQDTKAAFAPVLQAYNGNTYVKNLGYGASDFPRTFVKDGTYDYVNFGHNGSRYDIKCRFYVGDLPNGEYVFSYEMIQSTGLFAWHNMQIEQGNSFTGYEPYKGHTVPVSFGSAAGTVYGGTVDVVTGVLTVNTAILDLGSFTWTRHATYTNCYSVLGNSLPSPAPINVCYDGLCEQYKVWYTGADVPISTITSASNNGYLFISPSRWSTSNKSIVVNDNRGLSESAFKTAMNGVHLVCPLATPQTYNLTAQQVELLAGNNTVWADTGDITITWGADPYNVVNPTLFESKPLLEVTGHGVLTIGSQSITINGTSSTQVIHIDCDTMEAWEMSGSAMIPRNDYIQNAGDDFPKLKPGANKITLGVGITQVVVTPRWWRV